MLINKEAFSVMDANVYDKDGTRFVKIAFVNQQDGTIIILESTKEEFNRDITNWIATMDYNLPPEEKKGKKNV